MWTYQQSSGKLTAPDGTIEGIGYAGGNCGKNPEGVNNCEMETASCVGPLPVGMYTFGVPQDNPKLGPFAIPLQPDQSNVMYGRGGFFCHGDTSAMNHSASEGCIIMARSIRESMWASSDHDLQVVA